MGSSGLWDFDVLVAGGGVSGCAAAIQAARLGCRTAVVERHGFPGGMATAGLVNPMLTFHSKDGRQVIRGVASEIVDCLTSIGGACGYSPCHPGFAASEVVFDDEAMKAVLLGKLRDAGVALLFHRQVTAAAVREGLIWAVTTTGKGGGQEMSAGVYVDATGDGDLAHLAGAPVEQGSRERGHMQPLSLMFTVTDVDVHVLIAHIRANPSRYLVAGKLPDQNEWPVHVSGLEDIVSSAIEDGLLPPFTTRVIAIGRPRRGEFTINMTRAVGYDGSKADELACAEVECRLQVPRILDFLTSKVPGFARARLGRTACQVGVRETRRVTGLYVLSGDDVRRGRHFEDSVGRAAYPMDVHSPVGRGIAFSPLESAYYEVPYRSLVPPVPRNLLVCGRCISCSRDALASVRVMATCMVTGQAAGAAAALAVQSQTSPSDVPTAELQTVLRAFGVVV